MFYEGDEYLAQGSKGGDGCHIPEIVPGQVGQDSEQPGMVEAVPVPAGGWTRWALCDCLYTEFKLLWGVGLQPSAAEVNQSTDRLCVLISCW